MPRAAGILLHPSSLPGPFGIGDFGPNAYRWIDTLKRMRQTWWQILPLGPTGLGNSPYMSFSAFAGNINLLSPELLQQDGLIPQDLGELSFNHDQVDFDRVIQFKNAILRKAYDSFRGVARHPLSADFTTYCEQEKSWLFDYSTFMAIRSALGGRALSDWPIELLQREPVAMGHMERSMANEIRLHQFGQFLFDRQWRALKAYAHEKAISIIGDVPIFVALDSADVWANHHQFLLDSQYRPKVVAGVPPDYFSADGQLWGNPIYDWQAMKQDGYEWWLGRIRRALQQTDLIRLDHFRGFAQAWHVPIGERTAKNGKWIDGPGADLFEVMQKKLGTTALSLIAEDLGLITPDVLELRTKLNLPGMKVLQFAIGDSRNPYQPHNHEVKSVCYTGTHDNDTTAGWFTSLKESDHRFWEQYLGYHITNPGLQFLTEAWKSVSEVAIAPLQDVLQLGSIARMNTPGVADGNWGWRFRPEQFPHGIEDKIAELTTRYGR